MSFTFDKQFAKVVSALCDDLATPISQVVKDLCENGEWIKLQELKISPSDYTDPTSYWKDAMAVDLLRKTDMPTGIDKRAAALSTFYSCEAMNKSTNDRLHRFLPENLFIETQEENAILEFIHKWRKEVRSILKALPDSLAMRFGKGSTYGDKGLLITVPDKMSGMPTITAGARCLIPFWEETLWYRALQDESPWLSNPSVVRGNRFSTVPKTGLTDRGICIEPSINLGFQLDVGRLLKTRLKTIGIDLKMGQQLHKDRAQASSLFDTDATIDMSNASDTVCRSLVKLILPDEWWELLDSLRSPFTEINGVWVKLEKFSSMGNGFTFELESLIFSTLARLIVSLESGDPTRVTCYGDDLIVPKKHAQSVIACLAFFGFATNKRKTFLEGPFRESCGGDYFRGVPVRAHFIEELPHEPHHWISLANGLRRVGLSDPNNPGRFRHLRRAWLRCLDALPSHIRRLRGPEFLEDLVIHDDEEHWNVRFKDGCPYINTWAPVSIVLPWHHWKPTVQLAAATLGYPSTGVTPRGGISGYKVRQASLLRGSWLPSHNGFQ